MSSIKLTDEFELRYSEDLYKGFALYCLVHSTFFYNGECKHTVNKYLASDRSDIYTLVPKDLQNKVKFILREFR